MRLTQATIKRRGWVVLLCVVIVVIAAAIVAGSNAASYRVEAVLAVPASGGPANTTATPPGTLATTYAGLIPQDDGVVASVARATGLPPSLARQRISADQEPNTSIVDVTFTDSDRQRAAVGGAALVAALVGPNRAARTIPAGALQLARSPEAATVQSRHVPGGPIPIGIVLGLCLGLSVLIAWDRHDPRADDARALEEELDVPVTILDRRLSDAPILAVLERWRVLANRTEPPTVALVAATSSAIGAAARVSGRLRAAASSGSSGSSSEADDDAMPAFVEASPPGGVEGGELAAVEADLVVLVAVPGDRLVEVRRAAHALEQLGARPQWAIFAA